MSRSFHGTVRTRSGTLRPSGPALLIAALIVIALSALMAACNVGSNVPTDNRPGVRIVTYASPIDLIAVAPCLAEDGPGAFGGPVPCVWDGAVRGNQVYVGKRWVLYVEKCPVDTVQDLTNVQCVGRDDWSGGVS